MTTAKVVAALPAGGWRVRNRNEGLECDEPIVGWAVLDDGNTYAIVNDGEGEALMMDVHVSNANLEIYHPDSKPLGGEA